MPGVPCSYGDVTRIDLAMPFFLRDDAFVSFKNANYGWEAGRDITVLVKTVERTTNKAPLNGSVEGMNEDSVGGCPLECPFDPNENFDDAIKPNLPEPIFPGLDFSTDLYDSMELQSCRVLVKKIYDGDEETLQNLRLDRVAGKRSFQNPIYVACDGSPNAKDLVMIGFDEEKFLELRMMGPYKRQSTQLNLDLFLAYHQHLPNVVQASVSRQVHAVYEKPHGQYPANGKLFIEFLWPDPKALFETPPPHSTHVKLAVKPKAGDANPCLVRLWEEITALDALIETYESGADLNATALFTSVVESTSPALDSVKNLLSQPSVPNWKKGLELSETIDSVLRRVAELDRSDIDFTDQLWNSIKAVTQPIDLFECFNFVFSAVERKMYRPYIFPSNTTLVNAMLTMIGNTAANYRTKMNISYALELAINCGIHKLYKDYFFVLSSCKLADQSDLRFFAPQGKSFKESLSNVKKLHAMLEVLCLSKDRLALSALEQEGQTRVLLKYFHDNKLDWQHTFHFDVPYNAVGNFLTGTHPVYWNLKLESSTSHRIMRTNAILSRDFFVGHAKKFYVNANGLIPRGYYLYVHRIAQRKI